MTETFIERQDFSNGTIYYPVDCPWPSKQSDQILIAALHEFDKLVASENHDYVVLIASSHWCTEGYWIELKEPKLESVEGKVKEWRKEP